MPSSDPDVGEVWSSTGSDRALGLVIAKDGDMVRLLSRTGRRVAMPIRSLLQLWRLSESYPDSLHQCAHCDRHIPQGASIFFHSDDPEETVEDQAACPCCGAVSIELTRTAELEQSTYAQRTCGECRSIWYVADTTDLETGMILATHLPSLADTIPRSDYSVEIRAGFQARRVLNQATGVDLKHIQGTDITDDSRYGSTVVLVVGTLRNKGVSRISSNRETGEKLPLPEVGSTWEMKEEADITAVVTRATRDEVHVTMDEGLLTYRLDIFLDQFRPLEDLPESVLDQLKEQALGVGPVSEDETPIVGSFWRRRRQDNKVVVCTVTEIQPRPSGEYVGYRVIHNPAGSSGPASSWPR
jgi:hypothetical protein